MAGIIAQRGFLGLAPVDQTEAALHEAAHALLGHTLGWPFGSITVDGENSRVIHSEPRFGYQLLDIVRVSLAGPIASAKYLGLGADDDNDLLFWLHDTTRWQDERTLTDLRRNRIIDVPLESGDDISHAFHFLLRYHHFYVRPGSIPTDRSLLRHYRRFEQQVKAFVDSDWTAIERLAMEIIARPDGSMSGVEFEAFVRPEEA